MSKTMTNSNYNPTNDTNKEVPCLQKNSKIVEKLRFWGLVFAALFVIGFLWWLKVGRLGAVHYSKDGTTLLNYFSTPLSGKTFQIPDFVTSIESSAFYNCRSLTEITIPNSVTSIGRYAFSHCSSLTEITIPDSVASIGEGAFWGCSSLTEITIPDSVTSIGKWAFKGCTHLTTITIPNSVTSIGDEAFVGCTSLVEITIPDSVMSIGDDAFLSCPVTIIAMPDSCAWNYAQENDIEVVAADKSNQNIN